MSAPERIWAQPGDDQSVAARLSWKTGNCTTCPEDGGYAEYVRLDVAERMAAEAVSAALAAEDAHRPPAADPAVSGDPAASQRGYLDTYGFAEQLAEAMAAIAAQPPGLAAQLSAYFRNHGPAPIRSHDDYREID